MTSFLNFLSFWEILNKIHLLWRVAIRKAHIFLNSSHLGKIKKQTTHHKLDLQTPDQFERSWFEKGVTTGN